MERRAVYTAAGLAAAVATGLGTEAAQAQTSTTVTVGPLTARCGYVRAPGTGPGVEMWVPLDSVTQVYTDPNTPGQVQVRATFGTFSYAGTLEQWFQLCEAVEAQQAGKK